MKFLVLLSFISALVGANSINAQEWPRFRGPNGSGVNAAAKSLPTNFTDQDYRWKVDLPGPGTSSPALWGNKLFLTSEGPNEGSREVLCFDSATGKQLWSHADTFKPHGHHKFNNFASATPAVDADHVFIAWTSGDEMHVLALSHAGKKIWQANLGFFSEDHGSGASPVVVGNVLIVAKDHHLDGAFLTGLNVADGKTMWKIPRKTARSAFSTPLVVDATPAKPVVVFTSNPNAMTAVDPQTGRILWNRDYEQATEYRAVGSAAFCDGVYFTNVGQGTSGRSGAAIKLINGKPEIAWELPKAMPYVPTPLAFDGHFYVLNDGGILSCLKAATGAVVYSERVADNAYSSPVCGGNQIYCISRTGKITVVRAGEKFEVLGKGDLGEPCESTPAIANGMIFIRTAKRLLALGGTKTAAKNSYHGTGVDITLLSENASAQPGHAFTVGFNLQHVKGWHTYWKNPGLAGVPFGVKWDLPTGWKAGEIQYAPPDKVYMAQARTHGYEHDVTHLVELTPPANLPLGEISLKAKAHWLCCSNTCAIGNCELELSLPVAQAAPVADAASAQIIGMARALLPQATADWTFQAHRMGAEIALNCVPKNPQVKIPAITPEPIFFSDNRLICSDPTQRWTAAEGSLKGVLPVAEYAPKEAANQLTGLVFMEGKYYPVNVVVAAAK